jgi:predicted transcriptional regulator
MDIVRVSSFPDFTFEKYKLITGDPIKHRVFQLIAERLGLSGWEAAKRLGANPDEVAKTLDELSKEGIVTASGSGLDANYGLTRLGFSVRDLLVAGPQSR